MPMLTLWLKICRSINSSCVPSAKRAKLRAAHCYFQIDYETKLVGAESYGNAYHRKLTYVKCMRALLMKTIYNKRVSTGVVNNFKLIYV
jgi:hypothetical protein